MSDEAAAEFSLTDARRIAASLRKLDAFFAAIGGNTAGGTGGPGSTLNAPVGWITLAGSPPLVPGHDNFWKYVPTVVASPFVTAMTTPPPALALPTTTPSVFAFNTAEIGNTSSSAMGVQIFSSGGECGDAISVSPITHTYGGPILAQLFWTFFESGDPAAGYWAWWFTLPNRVNYQES